MDVSDSIKMNLIKVCKSYQLLGLGGENQGIVWSSICRRRRRSAPLLECIVIWTFSDQVRLLNLVCTDCTQHSDASQSQLNLGLSPFPPPTKGPTGTPVSCQRLGDIQNQKCKTGHNDNIVRPNLDRKGIRNVFKRDDFAWILIETLGCSQSFAALISKYKCSHSYQFLIILKVVQNEQNIMFPETNYQS